MITTPSGAPALELDGASDKLERNLGLVGLPSGNQDRTIFFVVDYEDPEGVVAGAVYGDSAKNEAFGLGVAPANGDLMVHGYGKANDIQSGAEGVVGGFLVQSAILSSGQLTQFLNGVATNTTTHNFNTDLQRLVIGEEIGNKGFADLNVAAVLIYDRALDEAERAQVESYLQDKYLTDDGLNKAPIAVGDIDYVEPGLTTETFVLDNDIDDGALDGTSITIVDGPVHGTITGIDPVTGAITYLHDGGPQLADSYTYRITDAEGVVSYEATVEIRTGYEAFSLVGFSDESVLTRSAMNAQSPFFLPISMAFLPDNRMLLLSKDGEILIVDPETGANESFMKLTNIDTGQERGLLDITLDPDFETNGHFYLYYTPNSPQNARISRFTFQENSGGLTSSASAASEMVVWEDTDGYLACCHYGGGLDFGPDGKIWLTTSDKFQATTPGEGKSGGTDLPIDLTSTSGKIIRVNKDGSVPDGSDGQPANPFVNGTDADGDALVARLVSDVSHGTLVLNEDGSFSYTPDANFFGADSFVYEVDDGRGGTAQATVTLNVAPVEDVADAVDDSYVTAPGATLTVNVTDGVLANDVDGDGDPFSPELVSDVSNGTLTFNQNGSFSYTPDAGFEGSDSFTYSVAGGDVATVTIEVRTPADPADAPIALDDTFALDEDTSVSGNVLADNGAGADSDPNGDPLTATLVDNVAHGTLTLNADGSFDYTPDADFFGEDSFVYRISDGNGGTSEATVTLNVAPVEDAAEAVDDGYFTAVDAPLGVGTANGVLANDVDADGDPIVATLVDDVANGTLAFNADGSFDYTPDAGFAGSDSFTYAVDGGDTATVTINVVDRNFVPFAFDAAFSTDEDTILGGSIYDDGVDEYIWAYGLRNPFRARWDAEYGQFYIGEVGGNQQNIAHEDVHVASLDQPGVFYGWPFYEGTTDTYVNNGQSPADPADFPQPDGDIGDPANGDYYSSPIWSLPHLGESASLTGGVVYRGDMFPEEWNGVYFYGDYTRDYIRYLVLDETGTQILGDFALKPSTKFDGTTNEVVSIEVGADGALYYAMIASGEIRRITFSEGAANDSPDIVSAGISPQDGPLPLQVTFTATVTDTEGDPMTYTVNFGDGTQVSGTVDASGIISADHTYTVDGRYSISLSVSDPFHTSLSQTFQVEAGEVNDPPVITGEDSNVALAQPGVTEVTFTANVSDLDGDALTYTWHFGDGTSASGDVPADGIVTETHIYADDGSYQAFLQVSDGTDTTTSGNVSVQVGDAAEIPVTGGLVLLLQSDIKIGLGTGNTVTAWLDGSGQGNNLFAQGDPQLEENRTPTGESAIVFDGTGDILQRVDATDTIFNLSEGNADRTLFFVVNYLDPEGDDAGFVYGDSQKNEAFGLVAKRDGDAMVQGWGSANDHDSDIDAVGPGWMVQSVVLKANLFQHYLDGTLIDSGSHSFNTDLQKLVLGGRLDGRGESQMEIAAVLAYDRALNQTERQQVEDFLQAKYITLPNTAPMAGDDAFTMTEDALLAGDVLADNGGGADQDPDGDPLTVSLVSGVAHGALTLNADGTFDYTPESGFSGTDGFVYQISDGRGGTDTASVTLTVEPGVDPADRPVAVDDTFAVQEDTLLSGNVLADNGGGADSDPNGDPLTVSLISDVSHGMLTLNADGTFDYMPDANFFGVDSFVYQVADGTGGFDQATAAINIAAVDDPADAVDDLYSTGVGTTLSVAAAEGVLANDTDVEGDPFTATLVSDVANGTLTLNADGSFDYTPNAGFEGTDSFTYQVEGGDIATVTIDVDSNLPVLSGLIAAYQSDENVSTGAGGVVTGWLDGSGRGNDLVALGDPELVAGATPTGQSAIAFDGIGDVLQRINATDTLNGFAAGNADRTLFFVVHYLDPEGIEAGFVYGDNSKNEAFGLVAKRDGDAMIQGWGGANDHDSDIDAVGVGWMVQSVVLEDDIFEHYLDGALIDSGIHVFNTDLGRLVLGGRLDGRGESKMEIAAVLAYDRALPGSERQQVEDFLQVKYITAPNASPSAAADAFTTPAGIALLGENVLADNGAGLDSDPDGDPLTVSLVSGVAHGALTLNADGTFDYTPESGFSGTDGFVYQISDGRGGTDTASVTLTVEAGVDPADRPVAVDDTFAAQEDTLLSGNVLVDNGGGADSDPNGDPLTVSLISDVSHGMLTLNADGTFDYMPDPDFFGTDEFVYQVADGTGGFDQATAAINIAAVDDPADAVDDLYSTGVETTLSVAAAEGVLANDTDVEGDPLTATLVTDVANGTLTLNADGSFDYTPNAGFSGADSFTYEVEGGDIATVTIEVETGLPVAGGLVAAYAVDASVSIGAGGVVTGWADGSGFGNHLVAGGDPTLVAGTTPTGAAAIAFDGTGDLLQRIGATDTLNGLPSGNADRTMFFVVNYLDPEGVEAGLVYGDSRGNEAFGLVAKRDGDLMLQGWRSSNDFDSNVPAAGQGWMVQSVVLEDDVFEHYLNGGLIDSGSHSFQTDLQQLVLGAHLAGNGESQMEIAAAFVYDRALTDAERLDVETYLQTMYVDDTFQIA